MKTGGQASFYDITFLPVKFLPPSTKVREVDYPFELQ